MSESDRQDPEGHDPTEEVGPVGCEIDPERAAVQPGALDGPPQESQITFQDEVAEAFVAEPLTMILSPVDGLPIPADESPTLATAAPYSIDSVVCIEDEREYVELYADELKGALFWTASPESLAFLNGERFTPSGEERARMTFAPERVVTRWGQKLVQMTAEEWATYQQELLADMPPGKALGHVEGLPFVAVRPARERCIYYKRQVFSNDDQPDEKAFGHYIVFRNCTERRSVGGAFMSVRDEAVYACDYREPPHAPSVEKYLDKKDRERLASKAHLVRVPLFGIPIVDPNYKPPATGNPMAPAPNVMVPAVPGYAEDAAPTGPRTADAPVLESVLRHDAGEGAVAWDAGSPNRLSSHAAQIDSDMPPPKTPRNDS